MLLEHKRKLYTKDNIVIAVAWSIQNEIKLAMMIEEFFWSLPASSEYDLTPYDGSIKPNVHEAFYDKQTQQNHIILGAEGFSLFNDEQYAAKLAMTIFGWMMSSRLFQNIREKRGLCYYIGGGHYSAVANGMFIMYAGMEKDRREEWLQAIYDETAMIVNEWITDQEYTKAIKNIEWWIALGLETSDQIAWYVAMQYLLKGSIDSLEERLEQFKAVTQDEVNTVLHRLAKDNLYAYRIQ